MLTANHLYNITGMLTPRPPFDFGKSLSFLHRFGPTADEQSLAGASLTKAVMLHGHTIAFEVQNEVRSRNPGSRTGSILIPWRMAHRTKMALVERWGMSITLKGEVYRTFPEPQQLAAVEPGELAAVVRNERKVEYLRAVIQFFNEVDE